MSRLRSFALLMLLSAALPGGAQQGGDLQAQILYGFQTGDLNQLAELIQSLRGQVDAGSADVPLRYHLAHADYRFAQVADGANAHEAEAALGDCIDQLKAVEKDARTAESLALQAACYTELANRSRLQAVILRGRAADRLAAAFKLAPRNPRVNYLMAIYDLDRAKPASPESQHAFTQLQLAAQLFEKSSATSTDTPGWGHAEAYLALGRQLLLRDDVLGARNWTEKALIAAPEFKAAQRQLAAIAAP
jgi:hypothetical protein